MSKQSIIIIQGMLVVVPHITHTGKLKEARKIAGSNITHQFRIYMVGDAEFTLSFQDAESASKAVTDVRDIITKFYEEIVK